MASRFTRRAVATSAVASALSLGFIQKDVASHQATPVVERTEQVAGVDSALKQLPAYIEQMLDTTGVPGLSVAVVNGNELLMAEGFGTINVNTGEPVSAETVFQVASVSKPISSTVISAVVGTGALDWNTRVSELMPGFALGDPWITAHITLADLFSHRSGLPGHVGDELEDLGGDRAHVLHALRYVELPGRFRDSYAYTNFGLTAAAEAVAFAMGSTWEDLADEYLFSRAGLDVSSFRYSDFSNHENRARLHVLQDDSWVQMYDRQPDAQSPAGGASTNVLDMARWLQLQLRNGELEGSQIVDAAALGLTHTPHIRTRELAPPFTSIPGFYGLGWNVGYDSNRVVRLGHSGAFAYGAATAAYVWPGEDIAMVVLTNGQPVGLPEALCLTFHDLVTMGSPTVDYLDVLGPVLEAELLPNYGMDVLAPPADPDPAANLAGYIGTYQNDFFGNLEITEGADGLDMILGPNAMEFNLTHFSRDVFTYEPIGEMAGGISAVTFSVDARGTAIQVVVENLDLYGAGTFRRND